VSHLGRLSPLFVCFKLRAFMFQNNEYEWRCSYSCIVSHLYCGRITVLRRLCGVTVCDTLFARPSIAFFFSFSSCCSEILPSLCISAYNEPVFPNNIFHYLRPKSPADIEQQRVSKKYLRAGPQIQRWLGQKTVEYPLFAESSPSHSSLS